MTNDISSDLGTRLRLAREAKGLRQEDVAESCGVTQQAVQAWEANRSTPRGLQRIAKLAELLGIEPADIRAPSLPYYDARRVVADGLMHILDTKVAEPRRIYERAPIERHRVAGPVIRAIQEERQVELLKCLPDNLRQHVGGSFDIRGIKYRYDYMSKRVVASVIYLSSIHTSFPLMPMRMALYRLALANRHANDFPAPGMHYLLAVISMTPGEGRIPLALQHEGRMFDTAVEVHSDMKSVCDRIIELEATPTELEEISQVSYWDEEENSPPPEI
jgi:transcriptional regulator with XRE-family HTH domain